MRLLGWESVMGFHVTFADEKYGYEKVPPAVMSLIIKRLHQRPGQSEELRKQTGPSCWKESLEIGHMFLESLSQADWKVVLEVCEELQPQHRAICMNAYRDATEEHRQSMVEFDEWWLTRVTAIVRELAMAESKETGSQYES